MYYLIDNNLIDDKLHWKEQKLFGDSYAKLNPAIADGYNYFRNFTVFTDAGIPAYIGTEYDSLTREGDRND